jgi:hypothetical protein
MWLKPENRCLVPANSFAEYAPEPNPQTKKKDVVWFALDDKRPLPEPDSKLIDSLLIPYQSRDAVCVRTAALRRYC